MEDKITVDFNDLYFVITCIYKGIDLFYDDLTFKVYTESGIYIADIINIEEE